MVHEVLAPGVEDGREAQLGLEALLAELEEGGAGALKEQTVKRGWVLEDERAQGSGEGEDPVEIADGQEGAPLLLEPLAAALVLAGRAVAVAATMGPPMGAVTLLALPHRPAQLSGATLGLYMANCHLSSDWQFKQPVILIIGKRRVALKPVFETLHALPEVFNRRFLSYFPSVTQEVHRTLVGEHRNASRKDMIW